MKVEGLTSTFGARISGIDLREAVPDEVQDRLRDLLWDRGMLVLPGQEVSREQQHAFLSIFAPPEPQPIRRYLGGTEALTVLDPKYVTSVDAELPADTVGEGVGRFAEFAGWHSDSTFSPEINAVATLRAEVTPPVGGDTCFASACAAFDDLSPMMQEWLEGCEALHWYPLHFKDAFPFHLYGPEAEQRFDDKYVPWRHPVVVCHPVTGRKGLFVNPVYTAEIVGLTEKESRELLAFLFRHCTSSDYVYRHHWTPNDLVIWDELALLHLAPQDFAPHPRRMIRITGGTLVPRGVKAAPANREQLSRLVRLPNVGQPAAVR